MSEPVEQVPGSFVMQVLGAKEVERLWLLQRVAQLEAAAKVEKGAEVVENPPAPVV